MPATRQPLLLHLGVAVIAWVLGQALAAGPLRAPFLPHHAAGPVPSSPSPPWLEVEALTKLAAATEGQDALLQRVIERLLGPCDVYSMSIRMNDAERYETSSVPRLRTR